MPLLRIASAIFLCMLCLLTTVSGHAQTITMWHPWSKGVRTLSELAAEYTRQTGVRVQVRSISPSGYNPWTGGAQPDIIGLSYPTRQTIERNARAGRLYNMQAAIQQGWYADLWPGPLQTFVLRGSDAPGGREGIYGVPLTAYVRAFIYNRQIFSRAGISPPQTWQGFLNTASELRERGVLPYAGGFDGIYPSFPAIYEWSYLGSHYLLETYFGRYPYTGDRWRRQFSIYTDMRRYNVTTYGAAQMNRTNAERFFLQGNTAIILDGPWFGTVQRARAPDFPGWGVFGPPVDSRAPFLPRLPGGAAEGAVINARSANKAAAIRFLRWLTEPAQQVRLANAMDSVPISERASGSVSLRSHLRAFVPYMKYLAIELRYHEEPQVLATLYRGVRNVLRGTQTPSEALSATQRVAR